MLYHKCDSRRGMSGGPVMSAGKCVAVHLGAATPGVNRAVTIAFMARTKAKTLDEYSATENYRADYYEQYEKYAEYGPREGLEDWFLADDDLAHSSFSDDRDPWDNDFQFPLGTEKNWADETQGKVLSPKRLGVQSKVGSNSILAYHVSKEIVSQECKITAPLKQDALAPVAQEEVVKPNPSASTERKSGNLARNSKKTSKKYGDPSSKQVPEVTVEQLVEELKALTTQQAKAKLGAYLSHTRRHATGQSPQDLPEQKRAPSTTSN